MYWRDLNYSHWRLLECGFSDEVTGSTFIAE